MDAWQSNGELDRLAYEMAPVGIAYGEHGVIRACNREFAQMFGFEREALLNRSFAVIHPSLDEFVSVRSIGVRSLRENGRHAEERIMARADGSLFWCRVRGRTLTTEGDPLARAVWSVADLSQSRPIAELSPRERQIVLRLMEGRTSKEIAKLLDISPRTVETYRSRLLAKFGAANVVDLLARLGPVRDQVASEHRRKKRP